MSFFIENWYLFTLALVSGIALALPALRRAGGGSLSPQNAVQRINREKAVVIDVREPAEFAAGHITNAKNVPLAQIEERLPQVVKNKALPVILVCATSPRAVRAQVLARKLGYDQAEALAGGLQAWRAAGLPVVKS
ncbi:MAG: rhodanese-like domain-containing protein [Comamonas sp.]|nr:rhodanese-like domain-containing protein [Comamonas sp.]